MMVSIYDEDVIINKKIKEAKYNRKCSIEEIKNIIRGAVSITFYGESAVKVGIKLGYIHPEAVKKLKGVKVAMFIKTY
jgi:hypothetical protein